MSISSPSADANKRSAMVRQAFRLELITLAWMTIEPAVAIASGIAAHNLTLTAFGIHSLIELASCSVLVWRLTLELQHGESFGEKAERTAYRIGGALMFALAAYVVANAGWKFWTRQGAEFSVPGLVVCVLAIPVMYFLSRRKLAVANLLASRALRTDTVENITCGRLAFVVVAALLAQLLIGAWWIDPIASLAVVWFVVREGRETWKGEACCA
jgi:divalent metal cation (Fe/Co/Zn/Cd) transporter